VSCDGPEGASAPQPMRAMAMMSRAVRMGQRYETYRANVTEAP
jgi:hypothetical protein